MAFQSLKDRLSTLPLVLAGPMLRKVTPNSVTVWLALRSPATVTVTVFDSTPAHATIFTGSRHTRALGPNLHIVAVSADQLAPTQAPGTTLVENAIYLYDATLQFDNGLARSLTDATQGVRLSYTPSYSFPSFCLPPHDLNNLRILHGSCRKPANEGLDAFAMMDDLIAGTVTTPLQRPQQLLLTGDQIYADDVAATLLLMLTDAATVLLGWDELLPISGLRAASTLPPYSRRPILKSAGFSSEDLDNHLLSLGEFLCMYLFVWSPVLWPADANIPQIGDVEFASQGFVDIPSGGKVFKKITAEIQGLVNFRTALPDVRRVLANIPTYTIFDDHEVTDDWNMTFNIAMKLYGTPLGRRTVQNALTAYSLCQHWGNVPEQFLQSNASLPGSRLLNLLDGQIAAAYLANSESICGIVGVPTTADINAQSAVFHQSNSLTYNYAIEGPGHQVIVTDTRTWRAYPRRGGEAPDLLPLAQFAAQFKSVPLPLNGRLLLVVVTTNAPEGESLRTATRFDFALNILKVFPDLYESWEIPSIAFDRLIKTLADIVPFEPRQPFDAFGVSSKVVLLSGDVHSAFASRLHYRAINRFEDTALKHANMVIAQLVASSFKKQDEMTIGQQREGYTYGPSNTSVAVPAHTTEYYIGWNVPAGANLLQFDLEPAFTLQPGVMVGGELIGNRRSIKLPPLNPVVVRRPPDYGYQLDYLNIVAGGGAPATPQPLPPIPSGTSEDERKESAHVLQLASANFRQHNKDPNVVHDIIGVNNFGDLNFSWPDEGVRKVIHRVRFHSPQGLPLFVDYEVNLETLDPDHPTDPIGLQVTP